MQTRLGSFIESCINTALGFVISVLLSAVVYPAFGHSFTWAQNVWITAIFTVASIARGFAVRRWANGRIRKAAEHLATTVGEKA